MGHHPRHWAKITAWIELIPSNALGKPHDHPTETFIGTLTSGSAVHQHQIQHLSVGNPLRTTLMRAQMHSSGSTADVAQREH